MLISDYFAQVPAYNVELNTTANAQKVKISYFYSMSCKTTNIFTLLLYYLFDKIVRRGL